MALIPGQRGHDIGTGIARAMMMLGAIGKPRMQAGLLNQFQDEAERQRMQNQFGGLLEDMDISPQQRGILSSLPPQQGMGILAQQAFAQDRQIPGRDVPFSEDVFEQRMALSGRGGEGGGPDIGTFNPRDYTAESFAKFMQSGNPNDLERFQKYKQIGGMLYDMTGEEPPRPGADVTGALESGAAATTEGGKVGEARAGIAQAEADKDYALETIKALRTHPGRVHGWGARVPDWAVNPNSKEMAFRKMHEQAIGQVFLQAYERLKGGGQITENETKEAKVAMTRLERATSREEYTRALNDLERAIKRGYAALRRKAKLGGRTPNAPGGAVTDERGEDDIDSLIEKYGGG